MASKLRSPPTSKPASPAASSSSEEDTSSEEPSTKNLPTTSSSSEEDTSSDEEVRPQPSTKKPPTPAVASRDEELEPQPSTKKPPTPAPGSDSSEEDDEEEDSDEVESSDELEKSGAPPLGREDTGEDFAEEGSGSNSDEPPRDLAPKAMENAPAAKAPPLKRKAAAAALAQSPQPKKAAAASPKVAEPSPSKNAAPPPNVAEPSSPTRVVAVAELGKPLEATAGAGVDEDHGKIDHNVKLANSSPSKDKAPPPAEVAESSPKVAAAPEHGKPLEAGAGAAEEDPGKLAQNAERQMEQKIAAYPFLWQEVVVLDAEHHGLFKDEFFKLPDDKAAALNAMIRKQRLEEIKMQLRLRGIEKEVTKDLIDIIKS
ncbi:hypothetical protein ACP70R_012169 [Stipagrostis hirtigluma subsp. patula]